MKSFALTTELLPHQVDAVTKLRGSALNALFMEQGTGKSRTVIELANIRSEKIDNVVWFAPVSLKATVHGEILKHTDCTESEVYVFNDKTDEDTIPLDRMWYVVGIESMSSSARMIFAVQKIITENSMVILDESTYVKGHRSKRSERITLFAKKTQYRMILTGTPITQGVQDLFAQFRFLSPKILGYASFYSFAANHLEYSDKYPGLIVRAHNVEDLAEKN